MANDPPILADTNLYTSDSTLRAAVTRYGGEWAAPEIIAYGEKIGSSEAIEWGYEANRDVPRLATHDRFGNRSDTVTFHPAWHHLMRQAVSAGLHALPWSEPRMGAHVARAAMFFLAGQIEAGHCCPISMTYSVLPALAQEPDLAEAWRPLVTSRVYDPSHAPAGQKQGALFGMGMTEKQGGSDVRANITRATPAGSDGEYRLDGHKWFCSAPMNDAFLVLAQAPGGLTCFLLPRWTPDGMPNGFHIQRLKDKLGNRSNASSEVEFSSAWAQRVGEEGRGVPTIIEMVHHTRLDCVIGSSSHMRQATAQAVHHARYRSTFGRLLVEHPLMKNVRADLVLESEAATLLMMRVAASFDDPDDDLFRRVATPVAKYWVCKRAPVHVGEALECLGGAGYVEESIMPRLFRESPLNSIWEGSGNVICLDVLRALSRQPHTGEAFMAEVELARGVDPRMDQAIDRLGRLLAHPDDPEIAARRITETMALTLQASLMVRHSSPEAADAFCASRLGQDWGHAFGTLPASASMDAIIAMAPA